MEEIKIEEHYILYVDILGYKNRMYNSDYGKQLKYLSAIKEIVDDAHSKKNYKGSPFKVKVFSDNIMFATKILKDEKKNTANLERLCSIASRMQDLFLKKHGILFRGAITKGQLYADDKFVFGKGICDAYQLENDHAVYPRIIIDKSIEDEPYIKNSQHRIDFAFKYDTYKFINFLCYYIPSDTYLSNRDINQLINKIDNDLLENKLDNRAVQKIQWVKNYILDFQVKYNL